MIEIIKKSVNKSNGRLCGYRGYNSATDRNRAIKMFYRAGYNYFVCYRDTQSEFALNYGWAEWVEKQPFCKYYVNR